jgi:hypothetical protein
MAKQTKGESIVNMTMTPLVIVLTLLSGIGILFLPRKYVVVIFFIMACYMTLGQVIMVGPFNFTVIRLLVIFVIIRFAFKSERNAFFLTNIDKAMIVFLVVMLVTGTILEKTDGLINRLGNAWTFGGVYFTIRFFVIGQKEISDIIKIISIIIIPIAICMMIEHYTRRNIFSVFGGVSEITIIRGGRLRCQGAFASPILAGTAGAVCMPQIIYLWLQKKKVSILGFIACSIIIYTSSSSGPIMTFAFALFAILFWPFRMKLKTVQIAGVVFLIVLQIFMKAPIWYLMARIDLTGNSTGWHRAELMNSAIKYINEWWLVGTEYTRHWMPTGIAWNPNHTDITNHFLHFGVIGGLPLMISFIMVLAQGFKVIGKEFKKPNITLNRQQLSWMLGAILFAHFMTFFSVSYFDQINVFLYAQIALIGSLDADGIENSKINYVLNNK